MPRLNQTRHSPNSRTKRFSNHCGPADSPPSKPKLRIAASRESQKQQAEHDAGRPAHRIEAALAPGQPRLRDLRLDRDAPAGFLPPLDLLQALRDLLAAALGGVGAAPAGAG